MRSLLSATPPSSTTTSPPPPPLSSGTSRDEIIQVAIYAAAFIIIIFSILCILCKKKKTKTHPAADYVVSPLKVNPSQQWHHSARPQADHVIMMPPSEPAPAPSMGGDHENMMTPLKPPPPEHCISKNSETVFTYEELANATQGFSDANIVGRGGFGFVHKGVLRTGEKVAIKRLKVGSRQGEREFQAEVATASRINHKNLVSLVGHCTSGLERLLVYEFVPNNTLEFHLHGKGKDLLTWDKRMKVAVGTAKLLAYLHECKPKIIHRDMKSTNILLNSNFEPKVADFGLARFFPETDTHVSTSVMGTFGYLAPEYAFTGKLTEKSDVFSFGVILLELITGRRPVDKVQFLDDNIVDWARPLLNRALKYGNFSSLVDARLQNSYQCTEMARMIACAAVCVHHLARRRPSMSQIAGVLEGHLTLEHLDHNNCHEGSNHSRCHEGFKEVQYRRAFESQYNHNTSTDSSYDSQITTHDLGLPFEYI